MAPMAELLPDLPSERAIAHLAARVLDCTLPKAEWSHAAHFAMALWCIRDRPDLAAPDGFRSVIQQLNEAHGTANTDSSGYHHTITVASIAAARAVHDANEGAALHDTLSALLAGPYGRPDWILSYWSKDRLFSVEARRAWLAPDLQPLPF